jgi:hypothetical protein
MQFLVSPVVRSYGLFHGLGIQFFRFAAHPYSEIITYKVTCVKGGGLSREIILSLCIKEVLWGF